MQDTLVEGRVEDTLVEDTLVGGSMKDTLVEGMIEDTLEGREDPSVEGMVEKEGASLREEVDISLERPENEGPSRITSKRDETSLNSNEENIEGGDQESQEEVGEDGNSEEEEERVLPLWAQERLVTLRREVRRLRIGQAGLEQAGSKCEGCVSLGRRVEQLEEVLGQCRSCRAEAWERDKKEEREEEEREEVEEGEVEEPQSLAEQVRAAAEMAVERQGMVYEPTSGLYYHSQVLHAVYVGHAVYRLYSVHAVYDQGCLFFILWGKPSPAKFPCFGRISIPWQD